MAVRNAQIRSVAVQLPAKRVDNQYFTEKYPAVYDSARERSLSMLWKRGDTTTELGGLFDQEMAPFLADPFRGTVNRHFLLQNETGISIELAAAKRALLLAELEPSDIDLLLDVSFLPEQLGPGNAAYLAKELGYRGAVLNIESTCSGVLVALQLAQSMIRAEEYRRILIVTSCTYSKNIDETDTASWFLGDAAAALVVTADESPRGVLGSCFVNTQQACGAIYYELVNGTDGTPPKPIVRNTRLAGKALREINEATVRHCSEVALKKAGLTLADVDFFVFNTPVAWFSTFCAKALNVPLDKTVNAYSTVANVGPVLMPINLQLALTDRKVGDGAVVLFYAVGSVSNAGSIVLRLARTAF